MPHAMLPRKPARTMTFVAIACLLPGACSDPAPPPDNVPATSADAGAVRAETVRTADGLEFDATLETPPAAVRNGWGVLMIGGGFGNDLDWTVPGSIVVEGQPMQMTISGETHTDAPVISAALAARGFAVLRWSTIARGDPLAAEWPARATTRSLPELTDQARAALATLRDTGLVEPDRVILLGHSLGAARACTMAAEDGGVRALILLAPAYFTREGHAPGSFESSGMRFAEDVLRARPIPCLALFGELDTSRAVNATAATALVGAPGFDRLEALTLPDLGHQLAPTQDTRHGPIDPDAVAHLARWADQVARGG